MVRRVVLKATFTVRCSLDLLSIRFSVMELEVHKEDIVVKWPLFEGHFYIRSVSCG
jgi:hypothetical protein